MDSRLDERLRDDVREELAWDALVDESQIDVDVVDGVVTLVGTVDSYAHKLAARDAAHAVVGVRDLVDAIDVRPPSETTPTDEELAEMVRHVLTWDALVPDHHLDVSVSDGAVVLSGEVPVASQRTEAERSISHLAGVRAIDNKISIHRPELQPDDVRAAIDQALRRRASHRAAHIGITVDDGTVTLSGATQTRSERTAIIGAVAHAPGIHTVQDELRIDPSS
jgi:osmotically-inducible protein OsmY